MVAETSNPRNVANSVAKAFAVLRTFDADLPELSKAKPSELAVSICSVDYGLLFWPYQRQ